jgi:general stress protein 26
MNVTMQEEIKDLMNNAKVAYVSSVNEAGYPNTKAMLALDRDGIAAHYFSSTFSSKRREQFSKQPKSCIYFCDETSFRGLMLVGEMQVLTDREHKKRLWRDSFEIYYPKGIEDEDYCVFKFMADWGNYYHGLRNSTFTMEDASASWNL